MSMIPDNYQAVTIVTGWSEVHPAVINFSSTTAQERFFAADDAEEDARVVALRDAIQALAVRIDILVPPGRNKSIALTQLEEVQMRANRGLFASEAMR